MHYFFSFGMQQAFFAPAQAYAASHAGVLLEVLSLLFLLYQYNSTNTDT